MCCKHYKEEIAFINSLIYASDPKTITGDEKLLQFKNLCVCSVYTSAILNNSKIKSNTNEHIDLFCTLEPNSSKIKDRLFCRICSWSLTLAS